MKTEITAKTPVSITERIDYYYVNHGNATIETLLDKMHEIDHDPYVYYDVFLDEYCNDLLCTIYENNVKIKKSDFTTNGISIAELLTVNGSSGFTIT